MTDNANATPGHVPAGAPPAVYARWLRAVRPDATDEDMARNWRGAGPSDRGFWTGLVAEAAAKGVDL
jgi:hypothetical protein